MSRYHDKCHWPCKGVAGLEGEASLAKKAGWWESAGKAFLQGHVGNYQKDKEVLKAWGQHVQKNEGLGEKNPWFWSKWPVGWCLPSPGGLVCWEIPRWQVQTTGLPLLDIGYTDLAAFGILDLQKKSLKPYFLSHGVQFAPGSVSSISSVKDFRTFSLRPRCPHTSGAWRANAKGNGWINLVSCWKALAHWVLTLFILPGREPWVAVGAHCLVMGWRQFCSWTLQRSDGAAEELGLIFHVLFINEGPSVAGGRRR